jgi:hypothetical protein
MAVPTTLLEFRTARRQQIQQDRTATETRLRELHQEESAARQSLQTLAGKIAAFDKQAAEIRKKLPLAPTQADGEALLAELETVTIQAQATRAAQLSNQTTLDTLTAAIQAAASALAAYSAALAGAQSEEDQAKTRAQRIQDQTTALSARPLDDVRAAATAALAGATPANDRIAADIPAALVARARERRVAAAALLGARAASLITAQDLGAEKLASAVQRAEDALAAYVSTAGSRLSQSEADLTRIADPSTSPLTPAQRARINEAVLVAGGTVAAAKEKALDDASAALAATQAALDDAILKALFADPDADPSADPAVTAATAVRDAAQTAFDTATGEYTDEMRAALSRWEAAVPEETWRLADSLEEAKSNLTSLEDQDPAALTSDLATAESNWVAALAAADTRTRAQQLLAAEQESRAAALGVETAVNRHRKYIALRGDQQGA